jgi:hypothetical protein
MGGAQFFMTFTDDCTKMIWTYFLKKKSKALVVFKEFQTMVENSLERKIKVVHNKSVGFTSKPFKDHCRVKGTIHPSVKWNSGKAQPNLGGNGMVHASQQGSNS